MKQLQTARSQRDAALLAIKADSRNMCAGAAAPAGSAVGALTALLRDLKRALEPFPSDARGAFGTLRGVAWRGRWGGISRPASARCGPVV
ncbi:MAG: hypothetical protein WDM77_01385 [Steroidobacteraceae bacterium]